LGGGKKVLRGRDLCLVRRRRSGRLHSKKWRAGGFDENPRKCQKPGAHDSGSANLYPFCARRRGDAGMVGGKKVGKKKKKTLKGGLCLSRKRKRFRVDFDLSK